MINRKSSSQNSTLCFLWYLINSAISEKKLQENAVWLYAIVAIVFGCCKRSQETEDMIFALMPRRMNKGHLCDVSRKLGERLLRCVIKSCHGECFFNSARAVRRPIQGYGAISKLTDMIWYLLFVSEISNKERRNTYVRWMQVVLDLGGSKLD